MTSLFRKMPIACVGLYATTAYTVARRTNEIGLRLALGSGAGRVTRIMLRPYLWTSHRSWCYRPV
jgi:hypothetical protein